MSPCIHGRRFSSVLLLWLAVALLAFVQDQAWGGSLTITPVGGGQPPVVNVLGGAEDDSLDLTQVFKNPSIDGTVVRLTMVYSGTAIPAVSATNQIDLVLYDAAAPITVANFLSYVGSGLYDKTFIHRAVDNFVIQGGGYTVSGTGAVTAQNVAAVIKSLPIENEFDARRSNVRGTIAMAKLPGSPDSATNEWFINLADNSSELDGQNGGFTVFGRVLGSGMTVADAIVALPKFDYHAAIASPLDNWPLGGRAAAATPSTPISQNQLVEVRSAKVIPALTFAAQSDNTNVVVPSVSSEGVLTLTYTGTGSATISVTATGIDGSTFSEGRTISVNVQPASASLVGFEAARASAPRHQAKWRVSPAPNRLETQRPHSAGCSAAAPASSQ